jgi:hypothetical protein
MQVLRRIEAYLRRSGVTATRFGRDSLRDPHLVGDLRGGRIMRPATSARLCAYLDAVESEAVTGCATPSSADR